MAILALCSSFSGSSQKNEAEEVIILTDNSQQSCFLNSNIKFKPASPDFILVQSSSLKAAPPPITITPQVLGAILDGSDIGEDQNKEIVEYIVEEGDTLLSLSERFGVSIATITSANDLTASSSLKSGQKLIILPVSGVVHYVKANDTIPDIARKYKGKIDEIDSFNNLVDETIYIGDIIIIPNGVIPQKQQIASGSGSGSGVSFVGIIPPILPPYIITQRLHWYNAIDFSHSGNSCGDLVLAVAGGTVQKTGYDRVAGNYVRILHSNGVVTFYGHLSHILVSAGQPVSQGTIIGYVGNTGYTIGQTGCHVHFEVRGASNPFNK